MRQEGWSGGLLPRVSPHPSSFIPYIQGGRPGWRGRAEFPREQTACHVSRGPIPRAVVRTVRRRAEGLIVLARRLPQVPELVHHHVEPEPVDELHDVIVEAILLAD